MRANVVWSSHDVLLINRDLAAELPEKDEGVPKRVIPILGLKRVCPFAGQA